MIDRYENMKERKAQLDRERWVKDSEKYDPATTTPLRGAGGDYLARLEDASARLRDANKRIAEQEDLIERYLKRNAELEKELKRRAAK